MLTGLMLGKRGPLQVAAVLVFSSWSCLLFNRAVCCESGCLSREFCAVGCDWSQVCLIVDCMLCCQPDQTGTLTFSDGLRAYRLKSG